MRQIKLRSKALFALTLMALLAWVPCSQAQLSSSYISITPEKSILEVNPGETAYVNLFIEYSYPAGAPSTSPTEINVEILQEGDAMNWSIFSITPSSFLVDCSMPNGGTIGCVANCTMLFTADAPADTILHVKVRADAEANTLMSGCSGETEFSVYILPEKAAPVKTSATTQSSASNSTPGFEITGLLAAISVLAAFAKKKK